MTPSSEITPMPNRKPYQWELDRLTEALQNQEISGRPVTTNGVPWIAQPFSSEDACSSMWQTIRTINATLPRSNSVKIPGIAQHSLAGKPCIIAEKIHQLWIHTETSNQKAIVSTLSQTLHANAKFNEFYFAFNGKDQLYALPFNYPNTETFQLLDQCTEEDIEQKILEQNDKLKNQSIISKEQIQREMTSPENWPSNDFIELRNYLQDIDPFAPPNQWIIRSKLIARRCRNRKEAENVMSISIKIQQFIEAYAFTEIFLPATFHWQSTDGISYIIHKKVSQKPSSLPLEGEDNLVWFEAARQIQTLLKQFEELIDFFPLFFAAKGAGPIPLIYTELQINSDDCEPTIGPINTGPSFPAFLYTLCRTLRTEESVKNTQNG